MDNMAFSLRVFGHNSMLLIMINIMRGASPVAQG